MDLPRRNRHLIGVLACIVASRVCYFFLFGVRFQSEPLANYMQFLDPELLRHDLLRSIYYLRDQPPLFNLFLGLVLKAFPVHFREAFAAIYFLCGLAFAVVLFLWLTRLRVPPLVAALITVGFLGGPIAVLYENWLFYTFPMALLLCASGWFLLRFLDTGRLRDAVCFFSLAAILVLSRGIFHPLWMLGLVAALAILKPRPRRTIVLAALVPSLSVIAFVIKTQVVFHTFFTGRPLQQMNLAEMTAHRIPLPLRERLIREHQLSPLSTMSWASGLARFRPYLPKPTRTGIPVLDQEMKSTGFWNPNHSSYVDVGEVSGSDARYALRNYPGLYLDALEENVRRSLLPADQTDPFSAGGHPNGRALRATLRIYDAIFAGQLVPGGIPWLHWIGMPLLIGYAGVRGARGLRRGLRSLRAVRDEHPEQARDLVALYCLYNILAVSLVTIAMSYGDHNRYRFKLSGLYCALLGLLLVDLHGWARARGPRWLRARLGETGAAGLP